MREYKTVGTRAEAEIVIKRSRFIGQVSPVADEEQAMDILNSVRKKHYEATHNCHAWIIDPLNQRSSDDGEPSGTAGRPILEVLRKEDLQRVLVVVSRYFGGIQLGANGLVRAYARTCRAGLEAAGVGWMLPHQQLSVDVDYSLYGKLENQVRERNITVLETAFAQQVTVVFGLPVKELASTMDWLRELSAGQARMALREKYYNFIKGHERL